MEGRRRRRDARVLEANCWNGSCHGPRLETKEDDDDIQEVPVCIMEKAAVVTKSESCDEHKRKKIWIILHQVPPDRTVVHGGLRESVIFLLDQCQALSLSLSPFREGFLKIHGD